MSSALALDELSREMQRLVEIVRLAEYEKKLKRLQLLAETERNIAEIKEKMKGTWSCPGNSDGPCAHGSKLPDIGEYRDGVCFRCWRCPGEGCTRGGHMGVGAQLGSDRCSSCT